VLTGALQGREHFLQVNIISTASTVLFQLIPLSIAIIFGPRLFYLLEGALLVRVLALGWLMYACHQFITRGSRPRLIAPEVKALLRYGGWVTVASLFAPMLYMIDRLAIGVVLNAIAVTIYTIPLQLTQRVAIVPSALTTALFPRLSASTEEHQHQLGVTATKVLCSIMTPPIIVAIFLIQPFLTVWVGHEMAVKAAPIGHILLIGFWANALALVPFNQIQARGRPDLVTKILIAEVPPYFAALFFGLRQFGLLGCAIAQTLRFIGDLLILSFVAKQKTVIFRLLALNAPLLLLAVLCAYQWSIRQWPWYAAGIGLTGTTAFLGWRTFPSEPKATILNWMQGGFAKMGLRVSR